MPLRFLIERHMNERGVIEKIMFEPLSNRRTHGLNVRAVGFFDRDMVLRLHFIRPSADFGLRKALVLNQFSPNLRENSN